MLSLNVLKFLKFGKLSSRSHQHALAQFEVKLIFILKVKFLALSLKTRCWDWLVSKYCTDLCFVIKIFITLLQTGQYSHGSACQPCPGGSGALPAPPPGSPADLCHGTYQDQTGDALSLSCMKSLLWWFWSFLVGCKLIVSSRSKHLH